MALQTITGRHCQQCGSTDLEDLDYGDDGYSACCNEIVVWTPAGEQCDPRTCYHESAR